MIVHAAALVAALAAPPPATARLEEQQWNTSYTLADSFFGAKDYRRAKAEFQLLLKMAAQEGDRVAVRFMLARCDEMLGDPETAIRAFDELAHQTVDRDVAQAAAAKVKALGPALGAIRVACAYTKAAVALSDRPGEAQGCPALFGLLRPGPRTVVVKGRFGRTVEAEATVAAGAETAVELPRPGTLRVRVQPPSTAVTLEAQPFDTASQVQLIPGRYKLLARAPNHKDLAQEVPLGPAEARTLDLTLQSNVLVVKEPPGKGPWPWVVTGAGAGIVAAGFYFLYLNGYYNDLQDDEPPGSRKYHDDSNLYSDLTIASYVTGGLVIAGGLTWLLWPTTDEKAAPAAALVPTPGGAGLVGRF